MGKRIGESASPCAMRAQQTSRMKTREVRD